ncbi:X-ray repair cross-complementing protein 6 [Entomophthora muscae]|uniref:X-ray repair cross-complementing protein 6 n=1 Tax=Entomophthora muscae TaxID=34485 RepID=A0ACC2TCE7_9FUNG|nr:X-ray repair cross-complementing protein 6 [Entomophthora muscae]
MSWGDVMHSNTADVLRKQLVRRARCPIPKYPNIPMEVAPGLQIGVAIYRLYERRKVPGATNQYESAKDEGQGDEEGEEKQETSSTGCRAVEYGGVYVHLTASEIAQAREVGAPGLKLLGFRPQSDFRAIYHLLPNYLLYPNEKAVPGSLSLFKALLVKMATLKVGAVAWYTGPRRITPVLVVLLPQLEMVDDAGQVSPSCWTMSILPSSEEIRHINPLPALPAQADEAMVQKIISVIEQMPFPNEFGFDPLNFNNPAHSLHFYRLNAFASNSPFQPHQAAREDWAQLTPVPTQCKQLLQEIEKDLAPKPVLKDKKGPPKKPRKS